MSIKKDDIMKKLKEKILTLTYRNWKKNLSTEELDNLKKILYFLDVDNISFSNIQWHFLNDNYEEQLCAVCDNIVEFIATQKKYKTFCSNECRFSVEGKQICVEKHDETMIKKYGEKTPIKIDEFKEKIKQTNLDRYGVPNVFQNVEIKENNRNKWEQNREQITEKIKTTKNKKSNEEKQKIQHKREQTNQDRYGVKNTSHKKEFMDKIRESKSKKTYLEKQEEIDKRRTKRRDNYWFIFRELLLKKNIKVLFRKEEYISYGDIYDYRCLKCGKDFKSEQTKQQYIYCPHCCFKSSYEHEISEWLSGLGIEHVCNKKFKLEEHEKINRIQPHEIDIFIEEYNLGIEFHGLYWHNDKHKYKNYHRDKWSFFNNRKIVLIQVFENEWFLKKEIVKSIILNKLGMSNKIYARKCEIREIDNKQYREFCEDNHLQGYGIAKIRLGLYHDDELIQLMSFSKSRYSSKYDYENIRTCTKINYHVVGGFSKLLKYFINNYGKSIISYVDLRYFNGKGYINNGFDIKDVSKPNYFYFKEGNIELESRIKYQKHKLKDILEIFDENMSEYENMLYNGYLRIFDVGNLILTFEEL